MNVPLRPIVSFVGSATYNLSKFLKNVLSPLVGMTKYSVKNSKEFVDLLSSIKIKDFESQLSPVLASIVMEVIEQNVVETFFKTPSI